MKLPHLSLRQYQWIGRLLSPVLMVWDAWRALRQSIYRPHRSERWARALPAAPRGKPLLWIHAISVGETQACAPLLLALLGAYPDHAVLLTHMTPTGRDTGRTLFANQIAAQRVVQCYLPYDIAGLAERFLTHFSPQCGVLMETEVWPHWVAACAARGVPLGLANGRLSEKSLHKALRFANLAGTTYGKLNFIAAQSNDDKSRFLHVCEREITVVGNMKFDVPINAAQLAAGQTFKQSLSHGLGRQVIALASTREGEEATLLAALKPWLAAQAKAPLVLLVPRHPKRSAELVGLLKAMDLSFAQRSSGQSLTADTQVYLGDTLGEMWFYYGASDLAIMGGGWANLGGQNLIEPCMAGCAVVLGPNMFNFATVTHAAVAEGAALQCTGLEDLIPSMETALAQQSVFAAAGQRFANKHAGSTARHLVLIEQALSTSS